MNGSLRCHEWWRIRRFDPLSFRPNKVTPGSDEMEPVTGRVCGMIITGSCVGECMVDRDSIVSSPRWLHHLLSHGSDTISEEQYLQMLQNHDFSSHKEVPNSFKYLQGMFKKYSERRLHKIIGATNQFAFPYLTEPMFKPHKTIRGRTLFAVPMSTLTSSSCRRTIWVCSQERFIYLYFLKSWYITA